MKKNFIPTFLCALVAISSQANLLEFINNIHSPTLRNVIRNAENIEFGNSRGVHIDNTKLSAKECLSKLRELRGEQNAKGEYIRFAHTSGWSISGSSLKGDYTQEYNYIFEDDRFANEVNRGLSNSKKIGINSYSSASVPHAYENCGEYVKIERVELVKALDTQCRKVQFALRAESEVENYNVLMCEKENDYLVDFNNERHQVIEEFSEIPEDCVDCR